METSGGQPSAHIDRHGVGAAMRSRKEVRAETTGSITTRPTAEAGDDVLKTRGGEEEDVGLGADGPAARVNPDIP